MTFKYNLMEANPDFILGLLRFLLINNITLELEDLRNMMMNTAVFDADYPVFEAAFILMCRTGAFALPWIIQLAEIV
jgi:hypothetical protein